MINRLYACSRQKPLLLFVNRFLKRLGSLVSEEYNNHKYLLVLDLEATCDDTQKIVQEIIEFPCLKVSLKNFKEEARFHQYVKPVQNPQLTKFCVELTGILQEVVDGANEFPEVFSQFEKWRQEQGLTENNSMYITSGDWDLGHIMPRQCIQYDIPIPDHMRRWIDIKKLFGNHNDVFYTSFKDVMDFYGLKFSGKAHSGICDCLNMLKAIQKMGEEGIQFSPTSVLVDKVGGTKVKVLNNRRAEFQGSLQ